MRKAILLMIGVVLFSLISVSALQFPVNHRYSGGNEGVIDLSERWEFREDIKGKDRGFSLTHSVSVPAEYRQSSFNEFGPYHNSNSFVSGVYPSSASGSYSYGSGSVYSGLRSYYSSGGYLNSGRVSAFSSVDGASISSAGGGALSDAFYTFRTDNARRDFIKNAPKVNYYLVRTGRYYSPYRYYY